MWRELKSFSLSFALIFAIIRDVIRSNVIFVAARLRGISADVGRVT